MRLSQLRLRWRAIITRYQQQGLALILRRVMRRATRVAFALVSLVGCTISAVTPTQPPTFSSATAEPTAQPAPTAQPTPTEDGWQALSPGIERQILRPPGTVFARLAVIRINPSQVTIRAHYRPGDPLLAAGWADALPDAAVIINANFFDRENHITGILFSEGVRYGVPYTRRGGTFFVEGGVPGIQSNLVRPYSGEVYDEAVQAFPMLMQNGARSYFDTRPDRATRRTVVAVDEAGRVLMIVTTAGGLTLLEMAEYLAETDLNIVHALNLDGGGSSLMVLNTDEARTTFPAIDPVPAVLAVYDSM